MRVLIVIVALFYSTRSFAQLPDSCNTVLWAVINTKGDTSYLFGTFHEFGNTYFDQYNLSKYTRNADCIVAESVGKMVAETSVAKNWVKGLAKADYRLIDNYMKGLNLDYTLKQCSRIPPSWVIYFIHMKLFRRECNTWNEQDVVGVDEYIVNSATTNKKELIGLESTDDTFNVVNKMLNMNANDDTGGVRTLKNFILNEAKYCDTLRSLCYEAQNYKEMKINYKFSKPSVSDDKLYAEILDRRNGAWLPQVKKIFDTSTAFIAVGIKHLYYSGGLIMQLQSAGYKVIPVELHKREVHYKKR